jgi:O6-methylguanine-DNA--protein-cysteine methyltransferase
VIHYRTIDSPIGPLVLAGQGSVLAHLRMVNQTYEPNRSDWVPDQRAFSDVVDQLDAYFAGDRSDFDLDLTLAGSEFQRRVWQALTTIPYGETRSYGQIAEQIGACAPPAPSDSPTATTRSPSSFRAIASSVRAGALPDTAAGSTENGGCSIWSDHGCLRHRPCSIDRVTYSPGSPPPGLRPGSIDCRGDGAAGWPNGRPAGVAPGIPPGIGNGMLPLATDVIKDGH